MDDGTSRPARSLGRRVMTAIEVVVRGRGSGVLAAALVLVVVGTGCRSLSAGDRDGSGPDAATGPTAEEFVAEVEHYLAALRDGDLDDAWSRVCQTGFGSSDRDTFEAHHRSTPRPTSWDLSYVESGSGTGRSAGPGGGGGTPSGAAGTVEFDDGTSGEMRVLYAAEGLCQVIGDGAVVRAVDPSP